MQPEILGPRLRGGTSQFRAAAGFPNEKAPVATFPRFRHGSDTACTEGPAWPASFSISSPR